MNPNQKNKGKKKFTDEEHKQWRSGVLFGVVRYTLAIQKYVSYNTKYTLIAWFGDGITTRLMGNEFATLTIYMEENKDSSTLNALHVFTSLGCDKVPGTLCFPP